MTNKTLLDEKMTRLQKISRKLELEAERAIIFTNLFDRANLKEDIKAAFNNSYEAHGLNGITQILLHEMILILVKVHDYFDHTRKDNLDRACLKHARHLLEDNEVKEFLVAQVRDKGRTDEDKNHYERHARELIERITNSCAEASSAPRAEWFQTLRDFRNNNLAHSLLDSEEDPLPKFGYITDLLAFTLPIISDIKNICSGDYPDFEGLQHIYKDVANRFWTASIRGMAAR